MEIKNGSCCTPRWCPVSLARAPLFFVRCASCSLCRSIFSQMTTATFSSGPACFMIPPANLSRSSGTWRSPRTPFPPRAWLSSLCSNFQRRLSSLVRDFPIYDRSTTSCFVLLQKIRCVNQNPPWNREKSHFYLSSNEKCKIFFRFSVLLFVRGNTLLIN